MPTQLIRNPVNPEQLMLLQQVFDETCTEHGIDKASPDGEALAFILVNSLQKGSADKEQLEALAGALIQTR
ncbi:hypothetical protein [Aliirhizobium smilacinae]|uniref:Uncharacterized protein n=1 Tax=Aliirhizobium smilacinae TaxID=1395944 RepID=A0A5C4XT37_9HYPH|nr:hypothetical protein [Rhizobium smilacinae]TNM66542.1 hypothetical protein FHP24_10210 [Rhizobium smilacinae]